MCTDSEHAYFALERQLVALASADLPPQEKLKQRMENYKKRQALLPHISFAQGDPFAQVLENPYPWDIGAPLPHVISNASQTYLVYCLADT